MDTATFLHHLRRSELLTEGQFRRAAERHGGDSAREAAKALVADGVLTRFQARQLLSGASRGLRLGPYRLQDQIGLGGSGVVYKALHADMRRVVALKVFRPAGSRGKVPSADLFRREALAASQLDHPHIVAVYDADRARGVNLLAMEYLDGPSLTALVQQHGPLPIALACELIRQAALGLEYAHAQGLVHRDIKPSNLLLTTAPGPRFTWPDGQGPVLKVADFGLARLRLSDPSLFPDEPTIRVRPGATWGSLDFISPEQLRDVHAADVRSDLYSLGCTFYFLLSGRVPFPGESVIEKLASRGTGRVPPLAGIRPEIPAEVREIVERLMARDPAERYQTAAELAQDPVLRGEPRPAPAAPTTVPDWAEQTSGRTANELVAAASVNGFARPGAPAAKPGEAATETARPIITLDDATLRRPPTTGRLFWPLFGLITMTLLLILQQILKHF